MSVYLEKDIIRLCFRLQSSVSLTNTSPSLGQQLQLICTTRCTVHIANSIRNGLIYFEQFYQPNMNSQL